MHDVGRMRSALHEPSTPLLLFARVIGVLPLAAVVGLPRSAGGLVAKVLFIGPAVIALVWLAWVALWAIEQC
jgi:hypothetical protein